MNLADAIQVSLSGRSSETGECHHSRSDVKLTDLNCPLWGPDETLVDLDLLEIQKLRVV